MSLWVYLNIILVPLLITGDKGHPLLVLLVAATNSWAASSPATKRKSRAPSALTCGWAGH